MTIGKGKTGELTKEQRIIANEAVGRINNFLGEGINTISFKELEKSIGRKINRKVRKHLIKSYRDVGHKVIPENKGRDGEFIRFV